jgi:hypothetical protein
MAQYRRILGIEKDWNNSEAQPNVLVVSFIQRQGHRNCNRGVRTGASAPQKFMLPSLPILAQAGLHKTTSPDKSAAPRPETPSPLVSSLVLCNRTLRSSLHSALQGTRTRRIPRAPLPCRLRRVETSPRPLPAMAMCHRSEDLPFSRKTTRLPT